MLKSINKVVRVLIFADFFLGSAWGFLGPVFAIFVVARISIGDPLEAAKIAGFASFVYLITKSLLQIPISKYFDGKHGERDDYWFMVLGLFLTGLSPFGFLVSFLPWHLYACQILHALGMALFVPSWNAIFTRHIDKGKEAFQWGMDSTLFGLGAGIAGALGGIIVAFFGFNIIFILVGGFSIFSSLLLLTIHKQILPRDHIFPRNLFLKR